jgi:hypothetical protein
MSFPQNRCALLGDMHWNKASQSRVRQPKNVGTDSSLVRLQTRTGLLGSAAGNTKNKK